jgi:hypothetical protein
MDERLSGVVKTVDEVKDDLKGVVTDVAELKGNQKGCAQVQDDRWRGHKETHETLSRRSNIFDAVAGAGGFGALLVALFNK